MITNKYGLHPVLYEAIQMHQREYAETHTQKSNISVTELISPPRMVALKNEYKDELTEDANDLIYAFLGSALHSYLEAAGKSSAMRDEVIAEKRLYAESMGWTISGMFDLLDADNFLYDYKLCSVWEHTGETKKEWIEQLNVLRWLCEENGYEINGLRIMAFYRDFSRNRAKSANYPDDQVEIHEIPMWSLEEAAEFVSERVFKHQKAQTIELPECTPEERWARPDQWALMMKNRKSAFKLHNSEEAAHEHKENLEATGKKNLYIQERPGDSVRCGYCRAYEVCEQRKRYE